LPPTSVYQQTVNDVKVWNSDMLAWLLNGIELITFGCDLKKDLTSEGHILLINHFCKVNFNRT